METLTYRVDGTVGTLTLNRPQVRNAMNGRMIDELRETLEQVNLDPAVRVLVLRGEGPVFCAGGDLRDLFTDTHPVAIRNLLSHRIRPLARALITVDKPVVCALQGPVAGAERHLRRSGLRACDFSRLQGRPGMAGRASGTHRPDPREQKMHRMCVSERTVSTRPCR